MCWENCIKYRMKEKKKQERKIGGNSLSLKRSESMVSRYINCLMRDIDCCPNSRCCRFQTPPTSGRNLDYFYPHIREISKVVCKKTLVRCIVYEARAHIYNKLCHAIRTYPPPTKLDAILCDQHALVINARVGFIHHKPGRVSCIQLC